jgi:hypothetical protein
MPVLAKTIALLTLSNVFMTFAWYAHLKELGHRPWIVAALVSWGIALFEYLLQVSLSPRALWISNSHSCRAASMLGSTGTFWCLAGLATTGFLDTRSPIEHTGYMDSARFTELPSGKAAPSPMLRLR